MKMCEISKNMNSEQVLDREHQTNNFINKWKQVEEGISNIGSLALLASIKITSLRKEITEKRDVNSKKFGDPDDREEKISGYQEALTYLRDIRGKCLKVLRED